MGWSSAYRVMEGVVAAVKDRVPDEATRVAIYRDVISVLEDHDGDIEPRNPHKDPAYDTAYREAYPPDDFDEDDE